jgi:hypothetical protein
MCFPAGFLKRQGVKRQRIAEDKYKCLVCEVYHKKLVDYESTQGLRKHLKKIHEAPGVSKERPSMAGDKLNKSARARRS